jgi:hypothetical protein
MLKLDSCMLALQASAFFMLSIHCAWHACCDVTAMTSSMAVLPFGNLTVCVEKDVMVKRWHACGVINKALTKC